MSLTEKRQDDILLEETLDNGTRTPDKTEEEKQFRRAMRRDVKWMKKAGLEIVIPSREPQPGEDG